MKESLPQEIYKELLKGQTVALVMEHDLPGVTPEMIDWWWDNIENESYKLWHPKEHHTFEWQIPPWKVGHVGSPLGPGPEDNPTACVVHEYEATAQGSRMRSTFTLPAIVPQPFLDELRKHNMAEMGQLPIFLPKLYREKTGK
jgi:hypothetical protein